MGAHGAHWGGPWGPMGPPKKIQKKMTSILVRGERKASQISVFAFLGLIFNSADRFLTFFQF